MKKLIFAVIFVFLTLALSCTDGEVFDSTGGGWASVYIGGSYMDNGVERACYWADGKRYGLNGYTVENITAVRGTVYAAGFYEDNGADKACYWVNQKRYDLPGYSFALHWVYPFPNISVDRGDVYVCGAVEESSLYGYWVNGVRREPQFSGVIRGVYAAGGLVYIVGSYTDSGIEKACYWVNGVRRELPNTLTGSHDFIQSFIFVQDNKVYTAGSFMNLTPSSVATSFWIDGVQQKVFSASDLIMAIAVSDGNIYMFMHNDGVDTSLYVNGELSGIDYGSPTNSSAALCVSNSKIYTSGSYLDNGEIKACYWVDGEQFFLDGYQARAIFVKE